LLGVAVFVLVGARARRWHGARGWVGLGLLGFAGGAALAWQGRQLAFAARDAWEWTASLTACAVALGTALLLARAIAARLADTTNSAREPSRPESVPQRPLPRSAVVGAASAALLVPGIMPEGSTSTRSGTPGAWLHVGWLFAMAFYGLLLVFDGRYRDFPLGLFALPCVGYALLGGLTTRHPVLPLLEARFLAAWLPLLAAVVLIPEAGLTTAAW
jgi:glucan 1,3-beta-glucosidase